MARGRKVAFILGGLAVAAFLGSIWLGREGLAAWWRHQTVKKLLDVARRDEVFREIVGWRRCEARFAQYFARLPRKSEVIDRVIECPQREGPPLFVVVFRQADGEPWIGPRGAPEYHFEQVDHDGTLIPPDGWNIHSGGLLDLNGDGVRERAGEQKWTFDHHRSTVTVTVFSLVAVTREQELLLRVAYRPASWTWEIRRSGKSPHADIVLGPRRSDGHEVKSVVARYRWDPAQGAHVGPAGGPEEEFVRASDFGTDRTRTWAELEPVARKQGER